MNARWASHALSGQIEFWPIVVLMSLWPQMICAMCGGLPLRSGVKAHAFLAAILDKDGGELRVGHEHDLQLRLFRREKLRRRDSDTSVPAVRPGR